MTSRSSRLLWRRLADKRLQRTSAARRQAGPYAARVPPGSRIGRAERSSAHHSGGLGTPVAASSVGWPHGRRTLRGSHCTLHVAIPGGEPDSEVLMVDLATGRQRVCETAEHSATIEERRWLCANTGECPTSARSGRAPRIRTARESPRVRRLGSGRDGVRGCARR